MKKTSVSPPKAVDLFSGAGGFSLGLCDAGFEVVGAADSWHTALSSYSLNFPHPVCSADLSQISGTDLLKKLGAPDAAVDLVVGGPPCQGFSVQRIGEDNDLRNHLVLEFARLVTELRPRLFLMENVPGLMGKRGRHLAEEFQRRLQGSGYQAVWRRLDAADYGVSQVRKRVFVAGWLGSARPFVFPGRTVASCRTVREAIGDLPSPPSDFSPHPGDPLHRRMKLSAVNQRRIELIPPGGGMENLPVELRADCHKGGAERIGHRFVYGRLHPDQPASTITARFDSFTRGKFGHPWEPRNITLREGARLQSFPDNFQFAGSQEEVAAQIGNAVPPLLALAVCRAARGYVSGDAQTGKSAEAESLLL